MHRKSLTVKEIAETFGDGNYNVDLDNKYGTPIMNFILIIVDRQYWFIKPDGSNSVPVFINNTDSARFILRSNPLHILKKFLATSGYIFLFLLSSCADKTPRELESYLVKFEQAYGQKVSIDINFVEKLDNNVVGVCYLYSSGYRKIELSNEYWNKVTELAQEELLFHELGHCVLNRGHNDKKIAYQNQSVPESIMYPYVFGNTWYYKQRRIEYIEELFNFKAMKQLLNYSDDIVIIN